MTAELVVGIAAGMFVMILPDLASRRREAGKPPEQPAARDTRQTVTISDPLLHDADLVYTFGSKDERKAFTLGVEADRDATITAMKLRKRIPATADLDFIMAKGDRNEGGTRDAR